MGGGKNSPLSKLMNIFVAVTAYDGRVNCDCAQSILRNVHNLWMAGHKVTVYYHSGDCYVPRARNFCVDLFLSTDCSDLIFIDQDIAFDDDALLKLIKYDKEIIVSAYPFKSDKEEYPFVIEFDPITKNCLDESTGLVSVKSAATGFMRIQRRVFEKMITHYNMIKHSNLYAFFDTGVLFKDDESWYGEDTAFCKRWKEMKGEIWLVPDINIGHIGNKKFAGNYHKYLLGRRIDNLDRVEKGIPGWMSEEELFVLRSLASKMNDVVEIGCWKGRSTKELLESSKGIVYAVDHWKGSPHDLTSAAVELYDVYEEFIKNVGHYPNLKVLKGYSTDIARQFDGSVDMVFIDGGHNYSEVKSDIEVWLPKTKKIICGHDYKNEWTDVTKTVDEKFKKVNSIDSIWWVNLEENRI